VKVFPGAAGVAYGSKPSVGATNEKGIALKSRADSAVAQELDARTLLLQSQLDYVQAYDEMTHAMGRTPE